MSYLYLYSIPSACTPFILCRQVFPNLWSWEGFLNELPQVLVIIGIPLQHELLDRCSSVEIPDLLDEDSEQLVDLHFLLPLHLGVDQHQIVEVFPECPHRLRPSLRLGSHVLEELIKLAVADAIPEESQQHLRRFSR